MSRKLNTAELPASSSKAFRKLFLKADYDACLNLLGEQPDSFENALARCEVLLRQRRYSDVIEALSPRMTRKRELLAHREMLLGAALGYTKDYVTGRSRLLRAMDLADDDSSRKEVAFYLALNAWMQHEHREALETLRVPLASADKNLRARARILESWIDARRHDLPRQAQSLVSALRDLDACEEPDEYFRSTALMTLGLLCRELPLREESDYVRSLYERLHWTASLQRSHFQVTRFLGWIEALEGNEIAAFRYFKAALELAPNDHWKVLCFLDRAMLARSRGESAFALDQLHEAHELAQKMPWAQTEDEERSALIMLAELFADEDAGLAQRYLADFRTLSTSVLPGLSYGTDPRVKGFAAYSSGVALLRLGDPNEAERELRDAWSIFEDFEYGWRAALAALALYQCTGDETWLTRAQKRIQPWPKSWIAEEVTRVSNALPDIEELPRVQKQVLQLLLSGASNAQIADTLGRSPHTIRNQIAVLFQRFKVKSRTQLAAKLMRKA